MGPTHTPWPRTARRSPGAAVRQRRTNDGVIASYVHPNSRVGVLVELNCETDIVARSDEFRALVRQVAEHIAAAATIVADRLDAYLRAVVLLEQRWVRDPTIAIEELIRQVSAMTGENIQVRRFARFHMGLA